MRRASLILALAVALVSGCGPRSIGVSSEADLAAMNEEIRGERVTLLLASNTRMACEQAVVLSDTCTCKQRGAEELTRMPTRHVVAVKLGRPGRGMGWGLLIGAGAGGLMGVMGYLADPDDLGASIGLVVGPVLYGLIGLIIGPFATYDLYEVDVDESELDHSESAGRAHDGPEVRPMGDLTATPPN